MADSTVKFTLNLDGNALSGFLKVGEAIREAMSGMDGMRDAVDGVSASMDDATDAVRGTTSATDDLSGSAQRAGSWFDRIGQKALSFDVITNVIGKVASAFDELAGPAMEFEVMAANMKTLMNGDEQATDSLIKKIREYGNATVYDTAGIINAQKTMMAFGLDAEFAFGKLKNIGDIALGDKQKMDSLALAFSQATSTGKLMGQDLLQMINAGFNPLEVISQKTGKSMAELKDEMSKGAISAEMLAQSLEWATEEGGRFYKGSEQAAQTVAGRIAKMKDTVDNLKITIFNATGGMTAYIAEFGKMLLPLAQIAPLFTMIGTMASWCKVKVKDMFRSVDEGSAKNVFSLGALKASIASAGGFFQFLRVTAVNACRGISVAIMNIPIVGWIAAGVTAVVALFTVMWKRSEDFRAGVSGVFEAVKAVAHNVWIVVKGVATLIWDVLKRYYTSVITIAKSVVNGVVSAWRFISTSIASLWKWITGIVNKMLALMRNALGAVGVWIREKMVDPIKRAFSGLWEHVKNIFNKILDKLGAIFAPIKALWNKLFPKDQFKDVKEAFNKGVQSRRDKEAKEKSAGTTPVSVQEDTPSFAMGAGVADVPQVGAGLSMLPESGTELEGGRMGRVSGEVSGKVQQVNITLKSMVETMNFNGGITDNARDVESKLAEMMARILGMAETAI